jgi:hypothetical protein
MLLAAALAYLTENKTAVTIDQPIREAYLLFHPASKQPVVINHALLSVAHDNSQ